MRGPALLLPLGLLCLLSSCGDAESVKDCLDTRWKDLDGDGFGDANKKVKVECGKTEGTSDNWWDCDDTNANIWPGGPEYCNGIDDNCDTWIDGNDAVDAPLWYPDQDGDGFGDPAWVWASCTEVENYILDGQDCDDTNPENRPGAIESCDGVDNDCDGETDEDDAIGVRIWYVDIDADGYGNEALTAEGCDPPYGYVDNADDCYDLDRDTHPDAYEQPDGIDNDCDGTIDEISGSLSFDGNGDAVWVADHSSLDIHGAVTFEAWVSVTDASREGPVLAKCDCGTSVLDQYWFGVKNRKFGMKLGGGTGWSLSADTSDFGSVTSWTHIASVWDGTNWFNYKNGELVESGTWSGNVPTGSSLLTIGLDSGCDNAKYKGSISDARIWNVARTQEQIEASMHMLHETVGLVARWRLDDGSGQVAFDASDNGHDGQLGTSTAVDDRDPSWSHSSPR